MITLGKRSCYVDETWLMDAEKVGPIAPVAKRQAYHVATLPRSTQRCSTVMEVAEKDLVMCARV